MKTEELRHLLDPDGRHVVARHAVVDDSYVVRVLWAAKYRLDPEPHMFELDVELRRFNQLDTFELQDEEEEDFV